MNISFSWANLAALDFSLSFSLNSSLTRASLSLGDSPKVSEARRTIGVPFRCRLGGRGRVMRDWTVVGRSRDLGKVVGLGGWVDTYMRGSRERGSVRVLGLGIGMLRCFPVCSGLARFGAGAWSEPPPDLEDEGGGLLLQDEALQRVEAGASGRRFVCVGPEPTSLSAAGSCARLRSAPLTCPFSKLLMRSFHSRKERATGLSDPYLRTERRFLRRWPRETLR